MSPLEKHMVKKGKSLGDVKKDGKKDDAEEEKLAVEPKAKSKIVGAKKMAKPAYLG